MLSERRHSIKGYILYVVCFHLYEMSTQYNPETESRLVVAKGQAMGNDSSRVQGFFSDDENILKLIILMSA